MPRQFRVGKPFKSQINAVNKCPKCKKYGLRIWHLPPSSTYLEPMPGYSGNGIDFNFWQCSGCFARFELIDNDK